jgi:hypothetical protein
MRIETSELWQSATAGLFILTFSACHTPSAPQYEPAALATGTPHAVAIRSFRVTDSSHQYKGSIDYGDLVEKYLASELQKDGLSVQLLPTSAPIPAGTHVVVDGEITRIDPSVASMTLSVRIAEPGREAAPQVASFTRNSRVFMSTDDLLTRCAAELAGDAAGVVRVQEAAVARDQGIARAVAHHRKVFLTPDTLEPGTYEFVKDLDGGKSFYGTVRQALNAFASEVAEPEGVDVVMDLERWFRPTGLAWAAPRTGGKGVILKDPCNFDPSRYRGNFYPEGDDAQYDPPLSARCAPSSPAVQGLARLQARDNSNIFAGSVPIPVPAANPSPVNESAVAMPPPSAPSASAPSPSQPGPEQRLQELKSLLDKKLISPEEYEKKRAQILGEL